MIASNNARVVFRGVFYDLLEILKPRGFRAVFFSKLFEEPKPTFVSFNAWKDESCDHFNAFFGATLYSRAAFRPVIDELRRMPGVVEDAQERKTLQRTPIIKSKGVRCSTDCQIGFIHDDP